MGFLHQSIEEEDSETEVFEAGKENSSTPWAEGAEMIAEGLSRWYNRRHARLEQALPRVITGYIADVLQQRLVFPFPRYPAMVASSSGL